MKFFKDPYSFPLLKYALVVVLIGCFSAKAAMFFLLGTLIILAVYVAIQINKDLKSAKPYFKNKQGRFYKYDIVIDSGSVFRPKDPGVLKKAHDETWFIVYEDGFEWCLSGFKNIVRYNVENAN